MHQLKKYVIALTNLYGLVHRDAVIEIYNQKNQGHIETGHIQQLLQNTLCYSETVSLVQFQG